MQEETGTSTHLSESLARMAGVLLSDETIDEVLHLISKLALRTIPTAAAASVSLVRGGKLLTAAHTDERALAVDKVQYEHAGGPCVAAIETSQTTYVRSVGTDDRWDPFREAAGSVGFASVLSVPLAAKQATSGALNLYASEVDGFSDRANSLASMFAEHAGVLVANAQAFSDATALSANLHAALQSREIIGQAKGILMAREGISADEAFDSLRRLSQASNMKLREVAARVVESARRDKEQT